MIIVFAEKHSQAMEYVKVLSSDNAQRKDGYVYIPHSPLLNDAVTVIWGSGHLVRLKLPGELDDSYQRWSMDNLPIAPEYFWQEFEREEQLKPHEFSHEIYQANTSVNNNNKYDLQITKSLQLISSIIKKAHSQGFYIYNCADSDREASHIFYSILEYIGIDPEKANIKRLWVNSMEQSALKEGFKNLRDKEQDIRYYQEAKARAFSDWLFGMNLSRIYTLTLNKYTETSNDAYKIGRIKACLIYMIHQREKAIESFEPKSFYEIKANFYTEGIEYEGKADIKTDDLKRLKADNDTTYQLKLDEPNPAKVVSVESQQVEEKPQSLHTLSSLQNTADKYWNIRPHETTKICQSLYLKKLTSYPRTDCAYITKHEYEMLKRKVPDYAKLINQTIEVSDQKPSKKFVNDKKVQEHTALILTKTVPSLDTLKSLSENESKIYKEIMLRTLSIFCSNTIVEKTKAITTINDVEFKSNSKEILSNGWRDIYNLIYQTMKSKQKSNEDEEPQAKIKDLTEGMDLNGIPTIKEGVTSPPSLFSEGQLVTLLQTAGQMADDDESKEKLKELGGIGKPSTRSSIIKECFDTGYLQVKKKKAILTSKGKIIGKILENRNYAKPEYTAKMEQMLEGISQNEHNDNIRDDYLNLTMHIVMNEMEQLEADMEHLDFSEDIKAIKDDTILGACPLCDNGEIQKNRRHYTCNNPDCDQILFNQCFNKTLSDQAIKDLLKNNRTKVLKGFKKKDKTSFSTALMLKYSEEKGMYIYSFYEEPVGQCPACKQESLTYNGQYYRCKSEECTTIISGAIGKENKTDIKPNTLKKMLAGEKVEVKNLTSKKGNKFNALCTLEYDKEKKRYFYKFHFDNNKATANR